MNTKISEITKVQRAVEAAMSKVIEYICHTKKPTSEKAHKIIDHILQKYNCESPESHIVAGGKQAVEPHNEGTGILSKNEAIVIDIFPRSKDTGYFADMTRTISIGTPSLKLQKMYKDVLEAQNIAISMLAPGVNCIEIQNTVENFFITKGYINKGIGRDFTYEEGFVHGVGHGVSRNLHDKPHIGRRTQDILKEGDIVTVEPGLYYYDIGAIRIEDLLVITRLGSKKITNYSYQFIY
jgi:Xaa-Pro aminopeptidase